MKENKLVNPFVQLLLVAMFPVIIALKLFVIWAVFSLVISGVKASTDNCDKKYTIEKVVPGDWLCEVKNK